MNCKMEDGLCDELSAYASGRYDIVFESGPLGASPGCTTPARDHVDCSGSALLIVDAEGQDSTATRNRQTFDTASDKSSSIYCKR